MSEKNSAILSGKYPSRKIEGKSGASYFGAVNSKDGFTHSFEEIFRSCKKVFIIKGGPGTGKSTLMRAVGKEAENRKMETEYFYCSSDTSSLDGIILRSGELAILDGTPPHSFESKLPGIRDEIINLGQFWSAEKLKRCENEAKSLFSEISSLYKEVYAQIALAALSEENAEKILTKHIETEKMSAYIARFFKDARANGKNVRNRQTSAFGVQGSVFFDSFAERADARYIFEDKYGISGIFLNEAAKYLDKKGVGYDISRAFLTLHPDGLSINTRGVELALVSKSTLECKKINTERFIKKTVISDKNEIKELRAFSLETLKRAEKKLSHIGELHDNLEKIYINSMDTKALGDFTKRFLVSVFKNHLC